MFFRFGRVSREHARTTSELTAAREIQRRIVPDALPSLPNCAIEAAYLPAQEVGGDFFQVFPNTDGSILVVVGDVSGKRLKAAMTGALAIVALRTLAAEILDPSQLLSRLNREILREQGGGFITCLCVKVYPDGQFQTPAICHHTRMARSLALKRDFPSALYLIWLTQEQAFK